MIKRKRANRTVLAKSRPSSSLQQMSKSLISRLDLSNQNALILIHRLRDKEQEVQLLKQSLFTVNQVCNHHSQKMVSRPSLQQQTAALKSGYLECALRGKQVTVKKQRTLIALLKKQLKKSVQNNEQKSRQLRLIKNNLRFSSQKSKTVATVRHRVRKFESLVRLSAKHKSANDKLRRQMVQLEQKVSRCDRDCQRAWEEGYRQGSRDLLRQARSLADQQRQQYISFERYIRKKVGATQGDWQQGRMKMLAEMLGASARINRQFYKRLSLLER